MSSRLIKSNKTRVYRRFRAIMFDVDGTLVRHHPLAIPTPRVCDAVRRAQEAGFLVSVATGRLVNGFEKINEHLHLTALAVLEGGARLYDPVKKIDLWKENMVENEAKGIIGDWYRRGIPFGFNSGGASYNSYAMIEMKKRDAHVMAADKEEWVRNQLSGRITLDEEALQTVAYDKVTHLISFPLSPLEAEEVRKSLHPYSSVSASVNTTHYHEGWCVYATHATATKQHGILELAKRYKIRPEEIIGVGDQEIDYPLLMACGLKVAMGNAAQSLKDIADYVAPSVEEDGAAEVIERFLLSNQE